MPYLRHPARAVGLNGTTQSPEHYEPRDLLESRAHGTLVVPWAFLFFGTPTQG